MGFGVLWLTLVVSGFRGLGLRGCRFLGSEGLGLWVFSVLWHSLPVSRVRVSGLRASGFRGVDGTGNTIRRPG